jgi:hypothetical protein
VCVREEGSMATIGLVVSNSTSATVAEVIIPTGETLENLNDVLGFAQRFRSVFDEINMWREPIKKLKSDFGVRQGCAGKRMQIGERTYDWDEFCRHFFNLSARRVNELLEEPPVEITDDDVDLPPALPAERQDSSSKDEEGKEEEERKPRKSKNKRVHHPTANRAALADFTKRVIPVLLNPPEGTTEEQINEKAREMAILFCEDHPDLATEFRLPDGFNLKPRIAELEKQIEKLKAEHEVAKQHIADNFREIVDRLQAENARLHTIVEHQRDQIVKLGREKSELGRELAALIGTEPKSESVEPSDSPVGL